MPIPNGHTTDPTKMTSNNSLEHLSTQIISMASSSQPLQHDYELQHGEGWRFADVGHVAPLSRDGSVHATDEVFNSMSHLMASMIFLLGSVLLVVGASARGEPWKIVAFSIYGTSLLFMFVASTLHHSISASPEIEEMLRMIDYFAIYPLIAGTFTPLCLVFFHDSYIGWCFFAVIWTLASAGMVMTITMHRKIPKWLSTTIYVTMGWIGAFMTYWLYPFIGAWGVFLLVLGGVVYTAGGYVFSVEDGFNVCPGRFGFHEIWHVAVILGAATHWCLMHFIVLPWEGES
jgi:hemolysin III